MSKLLFSYYFSILTRVLTSSLPCNGIFNSRTTIQFLSDTSFWVVGPIYPEGRFASLMNGKTAPNAYTGGMEIWETATMSSIHYGKTVKFTKDFEIPNKTIIAAIIYFNADDMASFYLNGQFTNCFTTSWFDSYAKVCYVTAYAKVGSNNFQVDVINGGGPGLISFRLEIILSD